MIARWSYDRGTLTTSMRWAGLVALVGNTFLCQELVRIMWDHADRVSQGERIVAWAFLDLSGGAWPATWIYWASHIWAIGAVRQMRATQESAGRGTMDGILTAIVILEIILIHSLVLMLRGSWHLRPSFLW